LLSKDECIINTKKGRGCDHVEKKKTETTRQKRVQLNRERA
jgi:hypothetical protein